MREKEQREIEGKAYIVVLMLNGLEARRYRHRMLSGYMGWIAFLYDFIYYAKCC